MCSGRWSSQEMDQNNSQVENAAGFDLEQTTYGALSAGFELFYLNFELVESETTTRGLTVDIRLPSGVFHGQFSLGLADGTCKLNVRVTFSSPLVDLKHLHCKSLRSNVPERMEMYHSKMIGFEKIFKLFCSLNVDSAELVVKITLLFQVQIRISEK